MHHSNVCYDCFYLDHSDQAETAGVFNTLQCEQSVKLLEVICCPATATPGGCFICGNAEASFNAQKELAGVTNCGTLDSQLSILPAGALCEEVKAEIPLDIPSFCECAGATSPPNTCKVCGDNQEVSTTATIPDGNGLTCSQGYDVAKYINNATLCASISTTEVKAACCIDKASGGINLSVSRLAAALLVGLACVI